jgi:hypothetical protein
MKQYYGNYLGVVISGGEKDPEGRGRTQVFIPHIMPALYEGWNKEGRDIQFDIVGEGLPTALSPEIIDRLQKILPWAECAAPIVGASPSVKNGSEAYRNVGVAAAGSGFSVPNFDTTGSGIIASAAAQAKAEANYCGRAAAVILRDALKIPPEQIVAAGGAGSVDRIGKSGSGSPNGQDWDKVFRNLGFQPVQVLSPRDAPPNSFLTYDSDSRSGKTPRNSGGGLFGHVEFKGVGNAGDIYAFGRGGSSKFGGSVGDNFKGIAWVPPNDVLDRASQLLGGPGVNPSAVPFDSAINLQPDGSNPATGTPQQEIADKRSKFADELKNPAIREQFVNLMGAEVLTEGNKTSGTAWVAFAETVMNRAIVENRSVQSIISDKAYYQPYKDGGYNRAVNNLTSTDRTRLDQAITIAQAGSNVTGGATHNASAGVARAVKGIEPDRRFGDFNSIKDSIVDIGGETFYTKTGEPEKLGIVGGAVNSNVVVQNPTPYQMQSGPSTNNQARGMFGYASEGTTVWVFFREGNPQFPVYFAASYGQREWQNMYQYSSPGIGAGAGPGGALPGTEVCDMRLYGGGQRSVQVSEESGLEPDFIHQIYSTNGSNLTFTKDHTEFNSIYDHVNRVMGDHHDITEANRETRVRGDMNTYAEQDVYVTIGNWSDEAVAASDEIQQYINEAMEIKSKSGNGGGGTTSQPGQAEVVSTQQATPEQQAVALANARAAVERLQAQAGK